MMQSDPLPGASNSPRSRLTRLFSTSLVRHVRLVSDWSAAMLYRRVRARGHTGIRRGHELVIAPMTLEGTRLTDIAEASRVTKNAVGQLANELESLGYVSRAAQPEDGRATLLQFTDLGIEFLGEIMAAGDELEREIADMIGADKTRQLCDLLGELATQITKKGPEK